VLGKYMRLSDTKVLDSAYQSEIPAVGDSRGRAAGVVG
jgi:hypothetical protein